MQRVLRTVRGCPLSLGLCSLSQLWGQTSACSYILHSTHKQEQLHAHNGYKNPIATQPEEDKLMDMFDALWLIADERGWTDNALLHKLIDVLENLPREQQEQIISGLTVVKEQDQ
jgi:hypothetical protein